MSKYVIAYDLHEANKDDRDAFKKVIEQQGKATRYFRSTWIVSSAKSAASIINALKEAKPPEGAEILVAEADGEIELFSRRDGLVRVKKSTMEKYLND